MCVCICSISPSVPLSTKKSIMSLFKNCCVSVICMCSHRYVHMCVHVEARGSPHVFETGCLTEPGAHGLA